MNVGRYEGGRPVRTGSVRPEIRGSVTNRGSVRTAPSGFLGGHASFLNDIQPVAQVLFDDQ